MDGWTDVPIGWESLYTNHDNDITHITYYFDCKLADEIASTCNYIFILAGGITSTGILYEWVKRRMVAAKYIYDKNNNVKLICLGGGSYHKKPIINENGYVIHESTACAEYLIELGVKPEDIYREWGSYDTIANGYFGFTNFILPLNIQKACIITSDFHMNRSKEIFEWINRVFNNICTLSYLTLTDDGLDAQIMDVRIDREKKSLYNLKTFVMVEIHTIEDLHTWFYCKHKAYCSHVELIRDITSLTEEQKKSY